MYKKIRVFLFLFFCAVSFLSAYEFYWDTPVPVSSSESRFPQSASNSDIHIVVWEDIEKKDNQKGRLWLSAQIAGDEGGRDWRLIDKFAGPYDFSGAVPNIFSVAVNKKGVIAVAVQLAHQQISVFISTDEGKTFQEHVVEKTETNLVAPRIYVNSSDGFTLFAATSYDASFHLLSTASIDGISWPAFSIFLPAEFLDNSFVPVLKLLPSYNAGNLEKELVVFQSYYNDGKVNRFQLYSTFSLDGGVSWSNAHMITNFSEDGHGFSSFKNQQPSLLYANDTLYIAWERALEKSDHFSIYLGELSKDGKTVSNIDSVAPSYARARQPSLFFANGTVYVNWIDNRTGKNRVYLARLYRGRWRLTRDSMLDGNLQGSFWNPLVLNNKKDVYFFWEKPFLESGQVIRLSKDSFVLPPRLSALSLQKGNRSAESSFKYKLSLPSDTSGIKNYSYIFTQNKHEMPSKDDLILAKDTTLTVVADADGLWYLKAIVQDEAGNFSKPEILSVYRDTTPPEKPSLKKLKEDEGGFLLSNTISFMWDPPSLDDGDEISSYRYGFSPVSISSFSGGDEFDFSKIKPAPLLNSTTSLSKKWYNKRNGRYVFSVAAVDSVGNVGEAESIIVNLNKYIPYTALYSVLPKTDEFGDMVVTLNGNDFLYDGSISQIYIDKDGKAPFDYVVNASDFTMYSNFKIKDIKLSDIESGLYRIGLFHSKRGLYMSEPWLEVNDYGTVKIGDYSYKYKPAWKVIADRYVHSINITDIVLFIIWIVSFLIAVLAIHELFSMVHQHLSVTQEVQSLLEGENMPFEKKEQQTKMRKIAKRTGLSLRYKMIVVTSILALAIILLVSIPLGVTMIRTQEKTLADGLKDRVNVLMNSIATGQKAYKTSVEGLAPLPSQAASVPEVSEVSILGLAAKAKDPDGNDTQLNYVWATNNILIKEKISNENLLLGEFQYPDETIASIAQNIELMNQSVLELEVSIPVLSNAISIENLSKRIAVLEKKAESARTLEEAISYDRDMEPLKTALESTFDEFAKTHWYFLPDFNSERLSRKVTDYIAYRPVLYRQGDDSRLIRGLVVVHFTTADLIGTVDAAVETILRTTIFIGVIAIILGVIGSLFLAHIIIRPIRQVVQSVSLVSNSIDIARLEKDPLSMDRKDEIGELAKSVNRMSNDMRKSAIDKERNNDGLLVQRAMLPLDEINGKKISVGHLEDGETGIFAYYKGAAIVSGDYFDYRKLNDRYFLVLKADASGHDEGASLVVTDFSAIYNDCFKDWTPKKGSAYLSDAVARINGHLYARSYPGKFVAFTLALYDSKMGDLFCCNAGDNIIHIFDASEEKNNTIVLSETPAAGAIDPFLIEMKGGYPVEKLHLDPGDILFLYTDGIEEEHHWYKDESGELIAYKVDDDGKPTSIAVPPPEPGEPTGDIEFEEMSTEDDRVNPIIEAVMKKGTYTLFRKKDPLSYEKKGFTFDFSNCEGTAEEAIMALLAVNFVFRMEHHDGIEKSNTVEQDKKIDAFLAEHFVDYSRYLAERIEHTNPRLKEEYLMYRYLKADEAFDDLTLMTLQRMRGEDKEKTKNFSQKREQMLLSVEEKLAILTNRN